MTITTWRKYRGTPAGARPSAAKRGYGRDWQRTRERKLAADPLCEDCQAEGRVTPATEVHHKLKLAEAPSQKHAADNLRSLCAACHGKRTARGE